MSDRQIQVGDYFEIINSSISTYFHIISIEVLNTEIEITGQNLINKDDIEVIAVNSQGIYILKGRNGKFIIKFDRELSSRQLLLTGIRDIDINILLQLDNESLRNICQTDSYAADICRSENLWKIKLDKEFINDDETLQEYINPHLTWKENYVNFSKYILKDTFGIMNAVADNEVKYLKFITNVNSSLLPYLGSDEFRSALKNGSIDVLNWLIELQSREKYLSDLSSIKIILENDNIDSYIWLQQKGITIDIRDILKHQSINIVKYVESQQPGIVNSTLEYYNGNAPNMIEHILYPAIVNGNLEFLEYILNKIISLEIGIQFRIGVISKAIESGNLGIAKLLYEYWKEENLSVGGFKGRLTPHVPSKKSIMTAIKKGYADIIRYLIDLYPKIILDKVVANKTLEYGHLEILRNLSEHGIYPTAARSLNRAAANHHFNVIRWIAENSDQPLNKNATKVLIAKKGLIDMLNQRP